MRARHRPADEADGGDGELVPEVVLRLRLAALRADRESAGSPARRFARRRIPARAGRLRPRTPPRRATATAPSTQMTAAAGA